MEQWLNAWCEGFVLAAIAWAVARPRLLDAGGRYRAWCAAQVGLALLLAIGALGGHSPAVLSSSASPAAQLTGTTTSWLARANPLISLPPIELPLAVLFVAWASVALIKVSSLAVAVWRIRAARGAASPFPPARTHRLSGWLAASRGRFALTLSDRVASACMLGFGRPLVALPATWLDRFSDEELDAVLLHELAHAERRDDLQHLAQELLVAACWFHPAAWWMARRMEFDREAACDDRAARLTTARRYAGCLVRVAEAMRGDRQPTPGLAVSGAGRARLLGRRIEQLVRGGVPRLAGARSAASLAALGVAVAAAVGGVLPPVFGVAGPAPRSVEPSGLARRGGSVSAVTVPLVRRQDQREASGESRAAGMAPVKRERRRGAGGAEESQVPVAPAAASPGSQALATPVLVPETPEAEGVPMPSLSSRQWDSSDELVPAPTAAAGAGAVARANGNGPSGAAAPFRGLGAALSQAGKRTGRWFSRGGASLAQAMTPR